MQVSYKYSLSVSLGLTSLKLSTSTCDGYSEQQTNNNVNQTMQYFIYNCETKFQPTQFKESQHVIFLAFHSMSMIYNQQDAW
jgi:hypothetical protein